MSEFKAGDAVCFIPLANRDVEMRKSDEGRKLTIKKIDDQRVYFNECLFKGTTCVNREDDPFSEFLIHWDAATPAQRAGLCVGDRIRVESDLDCPNRSGWEGVVYCVEDNSNHWVRYTHYGCSFIADEDTVLTRLLDEPEEEGEKQRFEINGECYLLTQEQIESYEDFCSLGYERGCSCHVNQPCSLCTHEGNPIGFEDFKIKPKPLDVSDMPPPIPEDDNRPLSTREQAFADKLEAKQQLEINEALIEQSRIQKRNSAVITAMGVNDRAVPRNGRF